MTWLAWLGAFCGILALGIQVNALFLRPRKERQQRTRELRQSARVLEQEVRKDAIDAEKRRADAAVIAGPWIIPTTCACGIKFDRPRMVTDERCQRCREKAWEEQLEADKADWTESPGGLIVRKDFMK